MIEGFEELETTQVGRVAEMLSCRYITEHKRYEIKEDSCKVYDTGKDFIVKAKQREFLVEVKGDNYSKGPNIAFEYMQENFSKTAIEPSGLQTTKSDYIFYYIFRWDTLYIFKKAKYDLYVSKGIISKDHSRDCNLGSETGRTKCYILPVTLLERDGFFERIIDNLHSSLK